MLTEEGSVQIVPVTVVMAEDESSLYVLSGSQGAETVVHHLKLASFSSGRRQQQQWRHVRVEASASSLGSQEGVTLPKGLEKYEKKEQSLVGKSKKNESNEPAAIWWWHLIEVSIPSTAAVAAAEGNEEGVTVSPSSSSSSSSSDTTVKLWLAEESDLRLVKSFLARGTLERHV